MLLEAKVSPIFNVSICVDVPLGNLICVPYNKHSPPLSHASLVTLPIHVS